MCCMHSEQDQAKPVLISETGEAHGWGSMPWKWVSYLTAEERDHVRRGTAHVLVRDCPPCGGGNGQGCRVRLAHHVGWRERWGQVDGKWQPVGRIPGRIVHRCACEVLAQYGLDRDGWPQ